MKLYGTRTYKDAWCAVGVVKELQPFDNDQQQHVAEYGEDENQFRDEFTEDVSHIAEETANRLADLSLKLSLLQTPLDQ